jgi:DNA-binding NtrC family response regulator
LGCHT